MANHRHGAARVSVYVPAPDGLQETLVENEPERYWVPPYVGNKGWVSVFLDGDVEWEMVEKLIAEGYHLVAPRRLAGQPARSARGGPSGKRR
jgi:predicted DNA-binding protein (MmcQ/YjbR family)